MSLSNYDIVYTLVQNYFLSILFITFSDHFWSTDTK